MNKIKASLLALAFSLSVVACGGGVKAEAEALAKTVCACKDAKCAQDAMTAFAEKMKDKKGTAEDAKAVAEPMKKAMACMTKLATGGKK